MGIFQTARTHVRPWTLDDAEAAFAIYGDEEVMRFLARGAVQSLEEQREWLATIIERDAGTPYGVWAVETLSDPRVVGSVILRPLPNTHEVEVGWHLGRAHWGKGYATEAAQGAILHGFRALGLDTIYAILLSANVASWNVARRLGMRHDGQTDRFHGLTLEFFSIRPGEGMAR